jgi:outer membrane protein OmpA-like peptidoglycan-associated protein
MNLRSPLQTPISPFPVQTGLLQRQCAQCDEKDQLLQRQAVNQTEVAEVPAIVQEVLQSPGQPLDPATKTWMESSFEKDFSQVQPRSISPNIIQSQLRVSDSGDAFEVEAERMADAVTRAERDPILPLPNSRNVDAKSRFDSDFSQVQVHTDAKAAEAAHVLNAEAFTLGQHIVFGAGRYDPNRHQSRHLLAHELTHVIQQKATTAPQLQRRLLVNSNHPSLAPRTDPAATLTSVQRFAMMDSLIQGLCDQFEVDHTSGEVQPKSLTSPNPAALAAGSKPTGCCCLNVLTQAPTVWTIEVSQVVGPQTLPSTHQVVLSPTNTPVEFGSFTAGGTLAFQGNVPAAGHELCGHAALEEIGGHPPDQDRTTTDVHDPTVRLENLISSEQGVPASDLRGLAGSSSHRGESVDRITIQNYPFNGTNIPASEQPKIHFAVDYIKENNSFVDILGHSDNVGSDAGKQQVSEIRAQKVRTALIGGGVPSTITKFGLTSANRFTHVAGVSDTQPPLPPLQGNQQNWRRVEILIAGFPAGAQRPPVGTPATVTPHSQNLNIPTLKASANPCVRHLAGGAYP